MKASEVLAAVEEEEEGRRTAPHVHPSVAIYKAAAILAAMFERQGSSSLCGTPIGGGEVCARQVEHTGNCKGEAA